MNLKSADVCLGVFAKFWQPGQVKTRLARAVGEEVAAAAYRRMLETTLQRMTRLDWVPDSPSIRHVLCFTPASREPEFGIWRNRWTLQSQSSGDLGVRMASFFKRQLSDFGKVLVIGSDCPHFPMEQIEQAIAALDEVPMVISPTVDGGYCLLGLRQPANHLFENMTWSQPTVLEETLARARQIDCRYRVLATQYDLDEIADFHEFCREHSAHPDSELASLAGDLTRLLDEDCAQ